MQSLSSLLARLDLTSSSSPDRRHSPTSSGGGGGGGGALLPSAAAALKRRASSALNLDPDSAAGGGGGSESPSPPGASGGGGGGAVGGGSSGGNSAASSKRNSCTCRKCSIFSLEDCEPKEVNSVIKYLKFRKVRWVSFSRVCYYLLRVGVGWGELNDENSEIFLLVLTPPPLTSLNVCVYAVGGQIFASVI